ncbi:MAG: response regulator [Pedobacter sp.]|nr:response regulator [Pedobacter sp.]
MKVRALVVDDEHSGRTSISILLKKHYSSLTEKVITASSLAEAIDIAGKDSCDICFLDIELHNQSGFDLIPHLNVKTKVVFVTGYSEYAIKAIKAKAFDYLLKPVNPIEFKACMDNYEKQWMNGNNKKNYLLIKDKGESKPIHFEEIQYIQANGPYSLIPNYAIATSKG